MILHAICCDLLVVLIVLGVFSHPPPSTPTPSDIYAVGWPFWTSRTAPISRIKSLSYQLGCSRWCTLIWNIHIDGHNIGLWSDVVFLALFLCLRFWFGCGGVKNISYFPTSHHCRPSWWYSSLVILMQDNFGLSFPQVWGEKFGVPYPILSVSRLP